MPWEPEPGEPVVVDWGFDTVRATTLALIGPPARRSVRVAVAPGELGPTDDPDEDAFTVTLPLAAVHPSRPSMAG